MEFRTGQTILTSPASTQVFRASQNSEVFLRYLYYHSEISTITPKTLPSSVSTQVFRASQNAEVLLRYKSYSLITTIDPFTANGFSLTINSDSSSNISYESKKTKKNPHHSRFFSKETGQAASVHDCKTSNIQIFFKGGKKTSYIHPRALGPGHQNPYLTDLSLVG